MRFRARFFLPLLLALATTTPAFAILFYSVLPSNGAGQTTFRGPEKYVLVGLGKSFS